MRGTALLVLAGVAAFAAAFRFRTAVHPGEISRPEPAAAFAAACRTLPPLGSLRIHTDDPEFGAKLRRLEVPGGLGRVVDVARLERSLARGSLAAWDAETLRDLEQRLRAGEWPARWPSVPRARPYFRDEIGFFDGEVFLRRDADVARVRRALPDAVLSGEPVLREAEEALRRPLVRAVIAALLAIAAGFLVFRRAAAAGGGWERKLLAMVAPLALLGWSGLGVDAWTLPALVLAGAARSGVPLLAGFLLLLSPILALQRIGLVLGIGGLLRLGPAGAPAPPSGKRAVWLLVPLLALGVALRLWFASGGAPPAGREPLAAIVEEADRVRLAREWSKRTTVVGGERFADARADYRVQRRLVRIHDLAGRRAEESTGEERERWLRVEAAAARDAVEIPRGLRDRRRTADGRAVLWLSDPVVDGAQSFRLYRAESRHALESGARIAAWILFALGALIRVGRGRPSWRDGLGPLFAFAVAAALLPGHGLDACLPVVAVAVFAAGWMMPVAFAAAAAVLPIDFWMGVGAFAMAAAAAHPSSPRKGAEEGDGSRRPTG